MRSEVIGAKLCMFLYAILKILAKKNKDFGIYSEMRSH